MIKIKNLTKRFGEIVAVNDLSLEIKKNELFGLLGPNGAGKTTTLNILSTYLKNDSGEISINKLDPKKSKLEIQKLIGVIPQEISLYEDLTGIENLEFWGNIYNLKGKKLKSKISDLLKMIGLEDRGGHQVKTYSGGMKRRLNIAAGIMHDPEIIFFDEPTVGVDPQSRNYIFEMIKDLHRKGKTIIYTSHYMEEVEKLCTRIAIIDNGKLMTIGTKEELLKIVKNKEVFSFKLSQPLDEIMKDNLLKYNYKEEGLFIRFFGEDISKQIPEILKVFIENEIEFYELDHSKANLEQVFLELTGRELRE